MSPDEARAYLAIARDTMTRMADKVKADQIDNWSDEALRGFLREFVAATALRIPLERWDATEQCIEAYSEPQKPGKRGPLRVIEGGKSLPDG